MAAQSETATKSNMEEIEVKLMLEGVRMRSAYDFREYAQGPLRRSIALGMATRESLIFCPDSSRCEQARDGASVFHKVR
jgi:hypothetical protein